MERKGKITVSPPTETAVPSSSAISIRFEWADIVRMANSDQDAFGAPFGYADPTQVEQIQRQAARFLSDLVQPELDRLEAEETK